MTLRVDFVKIDVIMLRYEKDEEDSISISLQISQWHVPDVGIVKTVEEDPEEGTTVEELVSYEID